MPLPAFDPVRDAVLNSPTTSNIHLDLSSSRPGSMLPSPSPSESMPVVTSPLTRRATDLAVLLNFDNPPHDTPLFTPTTPRGPPTLSHLLNDPDPPEQLSQMAPLRRRTASDVQRDGARDAPREGSYFAWPAASSSTVTTLTDSPQAYDLALPGSSLPTPALPATMPNPRSRSPTMPTKAGPSSHPSTSLGPSFSSVLPSIPVQQPPLPHRSGSLKNISLSPDMPPPPLPLPHSNGPSPSPSTSSSSTQPSPVTSIQALPSPVPAPAPPPKRQNSSPQPKPKPSPKPASAPSKLPYSPARRRTPAGSVLVPLSPAELARYRNYSGGEGTLILRKRKRDRGSDERAGEPERPDARKRGDDDASREPADDADERYGDGDGARKRRRTGDVGLVVEHYNSRPDVGVTQRQDSPIIGLKSFNNWVKSVLITRFAHPVLAASAVAAGGPGRGRVLDIGCGKGGDLTKWAKAKVREYVGVDIAAVSVEQAAARHAGLRPPRFSASFFPLDCYAYALSAALPPSALRPFDVVSLQFCMHYAFESERKARQMLANVAGALRPGGVFIGTVPDSEQLLHICDDRRARLDALPSDAQDLEWGNSVYKIRFEDRRKRPLFGHRYWFFLRDAVDDVPEYIVRWDNFVELAAEYGLQQLYRKEFHEVFEEHHEHAEFGPLLERMHVVDVNGESQMDEDQWEAANIYVAFAFEKR